MKSIAILVCLVTACAADLATTANDEQSLVTCCTPNEVDDCSGAIICDGGGGGGGGIPTGGGGGGGGGGAGGCPAGRVPDGNGGCVLTPSGNRCSVLVACDPTLGIASDVSCEQACVSFSAKCYFAYRCGTDPSCPQAHIGYCGVF